jgi:hypothetical protein
MQARFTADEFGKERAVKNPVTRDVFGKLALRYIKHDLLALLSRRKLQKYAIFPRSQ